jgi:predicted transcriptional regulator
LPLQPRRKPSETRSAIHRFVEEKPGASLGAVQRAVGVAGGTLQYHVHRLRRQGLVVTIRRGPRTHLFPSTVRPSSVLLRAISLHPTAQSVALAVAASPGCGVEDVRASCGLSRRAAYHHVKSLTQQGFVAAPGSYVELHPTPALWSVHGRLETISSAI